MAERVTVSDMMDAREARAQAQRALLARYPGASVVCLCMNIAGAIKRTENIERAFSWGLRNVKAVLAPCETLFDAAIHEKTGPEAMLCVRADARAIKRRLCALEDGEALGRLLDIDVIAPDGGPGPNEYDEDEEELIQKMSEDTYLVEGSMKLDDINDVLGTNLTSEDYDSIGGLIIDCLDRLPEDGEEVTLENGIHLKVQGIDQNRIIKVLMTIPEPNEEHVEHSSETSENHE